ncbi:MAG: two-component regulator propeller domain-containing protein [Bacteroidota bacterium]
MTRNLLFTLFLLIHVIYTKANQNLSFQQLLADVPVFDLVMDENNMLWIGTENGLIKYNSKEFKYYQFDPQDSLSLSDNSVRSLFYDSKHNLWVGTRNGLNRYLPAQDNFKHYRTSENVGRKHYGSFIKSITEDAAGLIWIGTENEGIRSYDPVRDHFRSFTQGTTLQNLSSNNIEQLKTGHRGGIWAVTRHGLNYRDPNTNEWNHYFLSDDKEQRKLKNDLVSAVVDKKGNVWIASRDKKISILKKNGEIVSENFPDIILTTSKDQEGNIYLGTISGQIFFIPADNEGFKSIKDITPENFKLSPIHAIYKDQWDNLWVGSEKGLFVHYNNSGNFHAVRTNNISNLPLSDIMSLTHDHKNRLWVSAGKNLMIKDKGQWKEPENVFRGGNIFNDKSIYKIYRDRNQNIWLGTFESGFYRISKDENKLEHFDLLKITNTDNPSVNSVWDIEQDQHGNFWIGTWGGGLVYFDDEKNTFEKYHFDPDNENSLSNDKILSLLSDSEGILWIGTDGGGLNSYDPEKKIFTRHKVRNKELVRILDRSILCLHEDRKGNIWIGSDGGGVFKYDKQTQNFQIYNRENQLWNTSVKMILEDDAGNLWMSTNGGGIFMFSPEKEKFIQYTEEDGLSSNRFHNGSGYKDATGKLFFGSYEGYTSFKPETIKESSFIPDLMISGITFNNDAENTPGLHYFRQQIQEKGGIRIAPSIQLISIELAAVEYSLSQNNYYRYRLKGLNDQWNNLGKNPRINLMNLSHGKYALQIQSTNADGLWTGNTLTINLNVMPPFYKTKWFLALVSLVFTMLLYILFRYKVKDMKNRQLLLEKEVERRTEKIKNQSLKLEKQNKILVSQKQELTSRNKKIIESTDRIRSMTKKIHQADQMKLRFFTNISHELRTPLTLIIGPLDQLIHKFQQTNDTDSLDHLITMRHNAERILRLFEQIMTFRKAENGALKLKTEYGNLSVFLQYIVNSFKDFAKQKNIHLYFNSQPEDIYMSFDREKLDKIFTNLLANALRFTNANGQVSLEVKRCIAQNQNNTQKDANHKETILISVKDTGIGIPEKDLENIFDRFYQVDEKGIKTAYDGVGIGLSLAKTLVEIHKGEISVESSKGKGSEFTVSLPPGEKKSVAQVNGNDNDLNAKNTQPTQLKDHLVANTLCISARNNNNKTENCHQSKDKTLLVVEDNPELRNYLVKWLQAGYKVLEADNGKTGIEIAKKKQPDLIVSDIIMPEMDGFELLKSLKSNVEISHIPVILLTAKASIEDKITGMQLYADAYISKPFHLQHLSSTINSLLENRKFVQRKYRELFNLEPENKKVESPDDVFLRKIKEIIENNIANPNFNVNQLSIEVGVSRAGIYRKLKALTNLSVNILIRNIRIKRAAQILAQNKLYINEIAFMVGFNDVQYFRKCFRKMYHMTPSEYVAKYAEEPVEEIT